MVSLDVIMDKEFIYLIKDGDPVITYEKKIYQNLIKEKKLFFESEELFEIWKKNIEKQALKALSIYFLSKKRYLTIELKEKLKEKKFSHESIDEVLQFLELKGYLSDESFVQSYIEKEKRKCYGPFKIAFNLKAKKIPEELVEKTLQKCYGKEEEKEILQKLKKKFSSKKEKLSSFLKQRGFTFSLIDEP